MKAPRAILIVCGFMLIVGVPLWAQQPPDPLAGALFPPELVMHHQHVLGLSEAQRTSIIAETQKAQARFTELQWRLHGEMEAMAALLRADRADEGRIMAQLDKILAIEREIKRIHIGMIVRIKYTLTADQRNRLQEIINRQRGK